jgi:hypothetical protein
MGLYNTRNVGKYSMVLRHGAISFPAGTMLTVRFPRGEESTAIRERLLVAVVRHNSMHGMLLGVVAVS